MNFTESFQDFSSRVGPTDLMLYAGAGLVLWVLFKDKLSPVQKLALSWINQIKSNTSSPQVALPQITPPVQSNVDSEDIFFKLVVSWKQTRDLAVQSKCTEAVKVADEMFPFLSPNVCANKDVVR